MLGLFGFNGLMVLKLFGILVYGIYYIDFLVYVQCMMDNQGFVVMMCSFFFWFYLQMECIYVLSEVYCEDFIEMGFELEKLVFFGCGVDVICFDFEKCSVFFWCCYLDVDGCFCLLCVGWFVEEKNLFYFFDEFLVLFVDVDVQFFVVGDGLQ